MQQNKISILCTRPVDDSMLDRARSAGLHLDMISFIETEPIRSIEVQQEIEQVSSQIATVVFTSKKAVEAVVEELEGEQPFWEIFCIGNTTKDLAEKYFGEDSIAGYADDAASLAELISYSTERHEVIFFCGDKRRPELPESLNKNGIEVSEIVVYQTVQVPKKLNSIYEGIVFFSPSAVSSFFQVNQVSKKTIFFAIGKTTAAEITKHANNRIIICDEPGKERLVELAIEFFT